MNKDLEIKKLLEQGKTIKYISELLRINHKVVEKVKKQGRYYLDINTGMIVFTSKKVSIEEQQFNYLCYKNNLEDKYLFEFQKNDIVRNRADNPRLAVYLGVNSSQTHRWSKKDMRLFGCDKYGKADDVLYICASQFMLLETKKFQENAYYIDKNGLVKGYKLWYVQISQGWLYYLKKYAYDYVHIKQKGGSSEDYYNFVKNKYVDDSEYLTINSRVGKQLGKWIIKQLSKYSFDYISESIELELTPYWEMDDNFWKRRDNNDLYVPNIFYVEKGAYYNNLLSEEYREKVSKYIY